MKLMRLGPKGSERPAALDAQGRARDLSGVLADITASTLTPAGLAKLRSIDLAALPIVEGTPQHAPPWAGCEKFLCIGLNYADHAAEAGLPIPKEPILFMKPISARVGCNHALVLPQGSVKTDWEVELGVVIGTKTRYVSEADALKHVAGYCVVNDVSEREYQIERGGTWDKGKGCDSFGPVGPYLVTADEVPDPQVLRNRLWVNGELRQEASTAEMIVGVAELIELISSVLPLRAGDVIASGTPEGVGPFGPGDTLRIAIDGVGDMSLSVRERDAVSPRPY